jgi:PTH1 family peptidyl-tRNA hydrolase
LPIGTVRVRKEGSSGGHKGTQNIIDSLNSENFTRIRIGISNNGERESNFETAEYVLDKFSKRELPSVNNTINATVEYVVPFIKSKSEIPCHSFEVPSNEENVDK